MRREMKQINNILTLTQTIEIGGVTILRLPEERAEVGTDRLLDWAAKIIPILVASRLLWEIVALCRGVGHHYCHR